MNGPKQIEITDLRSMVAAADVAPFVFGLPPGRVSILAGLESEALRPHLEATTVLSKRSVLFLDVAPRATADAVIGDVIACLARAARDIWPVWFADEDFSAIRGDAPGRRALAIRLERVASRLPLLSAAWARVAAARILDGRLPRVPQAAREVELAQLSLVLNPAGLVLVARMGDWTMARADACIAAFEWIARAADAAVLILCPQLPPITPPFDRVLFGAAVFSDATGSPRAEEDAAARLVWIAPAGRAHPVSQVEKRIENLLRADAELGPLFAFNRLVQTVRGGRYRVDLLWTEGRLVVELDGYDHAERDRFIGDRHRDYDLMLDGYRVLRIANDEISQDYGRAVEKIRSVVRLQR